MRASFFRRPLQVAAFFRKELLDVLRQPRLLLTMVIGPFAIMAVFGLGYRNSVPPMRTLFVGAEGNPLLDGARDYASAVNRYVEFAGTSTDRDGAERALSRGDVDLVVLFPDDPLGRVLGGEAAVIDVVHTRMDPVEQTAIGFATRIAVDQINAEVLSAVVGGAQDAMQPAAAVFDRADAALDALDGTASSSPEALAELEDTTAEIVLSSRLAAALTDRLADAAEGDLAASMDGLGAETARLRDAVSGLGPSPSAAEVAAAREQLDAVRARVDRFATVDPEVLVRPLRSEVALGVTGFDAVTDWYAPAAVVLVLQQFGVAFGALSFVRERQLGIVEVLRIAPIGPTVTVLGKYLAFMALGGAVGGVLALGVVQLLDVPIAAGPGPTAVVMAATLFASIGLGLVVSLWSRTDTQAVQYTMILLLASLFFSGFFLSVGQMHGVAKVVAMALPVTYGMDLLRDVMLRGSLDRSVLAQLLALGGAAFVVALFGASRRIGGGATHRHRTR